MIDNDIAVYDSLQQCSAATGIPLALLRQAKAEGCDGFQSNRIRLRPVLVHLFKDSKAADVDDAKSRLLMAEAKLAEAKAEAQSGANLRHGDSHIKAGLTRVLSPLRQRLLAMPSMLAGRVNPSDPEMARTEIEKAFDDMLKGLPND